MSKESDEVITPLDLSKVLKIGDVCYIDDPITTHEILKDRIKQLEQENQELKKSVENKLNSLNHLNKLWKSALKAYKSLKKKVESKVFPIEYIDKICHSCGHIEEERLIYEFSIPWYAIKDILKESDEE